MAAMIAGIFIGRALTTPSSDCPEHQPDARMCREGDIVLKLAEQRLRNETSDSSLEHAQNVLSFGAPWIRVCFDTPKDAVELLRASRERLLAEVVRLRAAAKSNSR